MDLQDTTHTQTRPFRIDSAFRPAGDQPVAIDQLVDGLDRGLRGQVLLGVTGSGKTFTMANVIERTQRPALVLAHNKVLAAQLYREFKELFPGNRVEYFVSYYDYYQPEAYVAHTDTFIEKETSINDELDKLRLSATRSLIERRDVIIVASVSAIYGMGSPAEFASKMVFVEEGMELSRQDLLRRLVEIQYERQDMDFYRGTFRVRGDAVDIFPAYENKEAIRIELFGDDVDSIHSIDPLTGRRLARIVRATVFPATFYVVGEEVMARAVKTIKVELTNRLHDLQDDNKLLEAQRLEQRTRYDLEMLEEMGTCQGIENYSRHFSGRKPGEPPYCLLDFFPDDFLLFVDESHVTLPQVRAMYAGDRSRKTTLVEHGFRLPSALDNRPLEFEEFLTHFSQAVFVSATPSELELELAEGVICEQVIRPTGLMDPVIDVRPATGQVDDLLEEVRARAGRNERVLVTTLTKRLAEELTEYYHDVGVRVRYMHSDIDTLERAKIIRALRAGEFDALVGVNLLREGLDLPEVSLVAILDADKEGFLRSEVALIQTCGRAARNVDGVVIFYADRMTGSMSRAIDETTRRRKIQAEFNEQHGITPQSIKKEIVDILQTTYESDYAELPMVAEDEGGYMSAAEIHKRVKQAKKDMFKAAAELDFETAAELRDKIVELEAKLTSGV